MRPGKLLFIFGVAVLTASTDARAGSIWWRSDTLMTASSGRPVFGAHDSRSHVQLLQYLRLGTDDLLLDGLDLEVTGVVGGHVADAPLADPAVENNRVQGDLMVGRLRWQSRKGAVSLALGRQYLFSGAGRAEHLDGLVTDFRLPWNLDLRLYGGRTAPWQVDYDPGKGDADAANESWTFSNWLVGGRVRWRLLERAVITAGFLHEGHGSTTVRQNLSFDLGYWDSRYLEALVGGTVDTAQGLPQEIWLQLISRPLPRLKLAANYAFQVPSLIIPRTSIFSVFALDSNHSVSLGAHYGLTDRLSAGLEGGARLFPDEEELRAGFNVSGTLRLALGQGPGRLVGLRVELLEQAGERFVQSRVYALYRFDLGIYTSADLYVLYLDGGGQSASASVFQRQMEEQPISVGGLALLGYRFPWGLSLQVSGGAFTTPLAKHDLRILARVSFAGSQRSGR